MNRQKQIIIVGIGEIAQMAYEYFTQDSEYTVAAFVAEAQYLQKKKLENIFGCPVVSIEECSQYYPVDKYKAFVAMGYGRLNHDRKRLYDKIKAHGYELVSYISSRAYVGNNATIGENCFILENSVVQRNVHIGNDVTMWTGSVICHGTTVEDHVFMSAHVAVAGFTHIGAYSFLGINSCVGDNLRIGDNNFIGMGVAMSHDTEPYEFYRNQPLKAEKWSTKEIFRF